MRTLSMFPIAATLLFVTPLCRAEWHQREEAIMGTRVAVDLWHDDAAKGEAAIDAVMAEMRRIDELMSDYKAFRCLCHRDSPLLPPQWSLIQG